jgi:hypothetical protein
MRAMTLPRPELRALLDELFPTDTDLEAFCVDHFPAVARRFAGGMEVKQKQTLLLTHADPEPLTALLLGLRDPSRPPPLGDPRHGPARLHVTSDLWDMTLPLQADLAAPAGVLLDRVIEALRLPRSVQHDDRIGFRLKFSLSARDGTLSRSEPLREQGVHEGDTLWLNTKYLPFAGAEPVEGAMESALFRGRGDRDREEAERERIREVFRHAGLLGGGG